MPATNTADRSTLDSLIAAAESAHRERDAIESCSTPEWIAAHHKASAAWKLVHAERSRLFKADRWGKWMTRHDRALATITGSL